jgi:predicted acylesterase/phospholipase RssA
MIPPRRIVLSGGGLKVTSLVGSLKVLEEAGYLKHVKEICGVSAGAFLGFMVATGCPLSKIESLILEMDFSIIRNVSPEALIGFPEMFGLDDGTNFQKFLESIFRVALNLNPKLTFKGFSELKSKAHNQLQFRCWATDLNTQTIREFSVHQTPNVKIIDALRASMCLPLYFIPMVDPINGHLLSDGGIQGNMPLHYLTDDECQESLSLGFSSGCKNNPSGSVPQDLMGFMNSVLGCLTHARNDECITKWSHQIIRIPVDHYPSWNFEATREDRQHLFTVGVTTTREWLSTTRSGSRNIQRRHSI